MPRSTSTSRAQSTAGSTRLVSIGNGNASTSASAPISSRTRNALGARRGAPSRQLPTSASTSAASTTSSASWQSQPTRRRGRGRGAPRGRASIHPSSPLAATATTTPPSWSSDDHPPPLHSPASSEDDSSADSGQSSQESQHDDETGLDDDGPLVGDEEQSSQAGDDEGDALIQREPVREKQGRPRACGGCLVVFLLATLFSIPAVLLYFASSMPPAPPCHVRQNPNHFVPCALAIDLNRALSAIPDHVTPGDPDQLFQHRANPSLYDDYLSSLIRFSPPHGHNSLDSGAIEDILHEAHYAHAVRDQVNLEGPSLLNSFLRALRRQYSELDQETAALRSVAETLVRDLYNALRTDSKRQEALIYGHRLLRTRIQQQHDLDQRVHRLSQNDGSRGFHLSAAEVTSKLESERQNLLRLLLSEATLSCWLEAVEQLESIPRAWSQQVWKEGQVFLHQVRHIRGDSQLLARIIANQTRRWGEKAESLAMDGSNSALRTQESCAKRWAERRIGYCVADKSSTNVYQNWTALDPTGSGCVSHHDRTLWEWHNAIPIKLDFEDEEHAITSATQNHDNTATRDPSSSLLPPIFPPSRFARLWMHRVFTQADLAKYIKVGKRGIVLEFNEDAVLGIGPLRFRKLDAGWVEDAEAAR
ncbi:hypothetical protein AC578_7040 [Pseudocercospora eumusae]|uniref:Uncharacterized protein n=1 Tax=Pseudocercospora eumusae TaxID=321146 RepID=A0A139GW07_9PEZI|nr:hypothetical protein AC578_7040 [Pseudocercospora eumusae]